MLEPYVLKETSTVLRGVGDSNISLLPDKRTEITINGQSFKEIMEKINEPFDSSVLKEDPKGKKYVPIEVVRERITEHIGDLNYDYIILSEEINDVRDKLFIKEHGRIVIYDDNNNIVCTKEAIGTHNVILDKNDKTTPKDIANDYKIVLSKTFKACCKMLGMKITVKDTTGGSKSPKNSNSELIEEVIIEPISAAAVMSSKKGLKFSAMDVNSEEEIEYIAWKNATPKELYEHFQSLKGKNENYVNCKVNKSNFHGKPQYTFKEYIQSFKNPKVSNM